MLPSWLQKEIRCFVLIRQGVGLRFDFGSGKVPRRKSGHMKVSIVLLGVVLVALIGIISLVLR
jgi:hypothetical protein